MADDEDHAIGGKIIGAMMVQLLAAFRAIIAHLQIGAEQAALAATRAEAAEAAG